MSNKNLFNYYGLWGKINNEDFNSVESHRIKIDESPYNRWKRDFNAIGIMENIDIKIGNDVYNTEDRKDKKYMEK